MIYLLELPDDAPPRVWFAFDGDDLRAKLAVRGGPPGCELRLWPDEASAVLAFEDEAEPLWQGTGWRARRALHEQLVATEALAAD
jgi:hypothetical protein